MTPKSTRRAAFAARVAMLSLPVSALVAGSPALAAPVYNWTGFYAGLYAGGAWGKGKSSATSDCPDFTTTPGGYFCEGSLPDTQANASAVTGAASGSKSSLGFTGGVQFGYNWQTGNIVSGIEGDFGAFKINATRSVSGVYPADTYDPLAGRNFTVSNSFNTDWLLTTRGRVGWTASNWLIFATGGLAMSRVGIESSFSDNFGVGASGSGTNSKIKVGWTVGGGVEVALTKNWSVKGEYLYVDLGSVDVVGKVTNPSAVAIGYANALGVSTSLTAHVARLAANFRF